MQKHSLLLWQRLSERRQDTQISADVCRTDCWYLRSNHTHREGNQTRKGCELFTSKIEIFFLKFLTADAAVGAYQKRKKDRSRQETYTSGLRDP